MNKIYTVHKKCSYINHLGLEGFVDQNWGTFADEAEAHVFADYLADDRPSDNTNIPYPPVMDKNEDNDVYQSPHYKKRIVVEEVVLHNSASSGVKAYEQYGIDEQERWKATSLRLDEAIANNDIEGIFENMFPH